MSIISDVLSTVENLTKAARYSTKPLANESAWTGTSAKDSNPVVEPPVEDNEALVWDPFSIIEQLGFKDRPSSITYGTLSTIVWKVPLIQSIIMTRLNQMAAFCRPMEDMFSPGFRVTPSDNDAKLTAADRKYATKMQDMILHTGVRSSTSIETSFEYFVRSVIRDSLTYDQACFQVLKNRRGEPAGFFPVDASTIRLADTAKATYKDDPKRIHTVQIYDNMVINEWTSDRMAFAVRNPNTSIRLYGYGTSEIEMLINVVTALLWSFDYNQKFFSQGSVAKGLLNIKGAMNTSQLQSFRRQWYQMISGVENAWRSPVLNSDGDVQWVSMHTSNRDMEFSMWMDFLIKLGSGVFQIDPMEMGFKYGNTGQGKEMFESGTTAKLTASRDKGLRPLLQWLGDVMTNYVVRPIDKDWKFQFVGLDQHSKDELAELNAKRVKTTHTINELRAEQDLPPKKGEAYDTILDPVVAQLINAEKSMQAQKEAMAAQGGPESDEDDGGGFTEEDFASLSGPSNVEKSMVNIRLEI